ncbi:MAG: hypothetical protein IJM69_06870 [Firmicutes bacterium]|nr:hypothetical protein [Bacillota bacterium]
MKDADLFYQKIQRQAISAPASETAPVLLQSGTIRSDLLKELLKTACFHCICIKIKVIFNKPDRRRACGRLIGCRLF